MTLGSTFLKDGQTSFTVWAPLKEKMVLHIVYPVDKKTGMKKDAAGYFHAVEETGPGCRYFFMPEGEKDIPDPASKFQPEGVHGPSEVVDQSYRWKDEKWKSHPFHELILYELHVGTYTQEGTFEAIVWKLDHLVETGINAIELMPVAQFPGSRNWGYDGVFPYAIHNSYGGPCGLKKLVDACHQKGIAVFLDVVYNHLGPEGNYLEEFGPYFTDHYKTPWGKAINFDGEYSDPVRDFFSENACYLFEHFHIDGLRFDAIHGVHDMGTIHFWTFMHEKIRNLQQKTGRIFHTIAESDYNDPKVIRDIEAGGYGFTAQWMDDFHHALYTLVDVEEGKKLYADFGQLDQLAKAYKDGFVHSGEYVNFRKRKYGASSAGINGDKFVVFIDNHDQAGNRVSGGCLASLISFENLKLASAAYLLSPYIPMMFMGEEYGDDAPFFYFVSHGDEALIDLVRKGRKAEFGHFGWHTEPPDPYDEKTFRQSILQWQKIGEKKHNTIHRWYKELIRLRKTASPLQSFDKNDIWVSVMATMIHFHRRCSGRREEIDCIINFSGETESRFVVPSSLPRYCKLIDSNDEQWLIEERKSPVLPGAVQAGQEIIIPPLTVVVYGN